VQLNGQKPAPPPRTQSLGVGWRAPYRAGTARNGSGATPPSDVND
jgi:hypothetical protein